MKHKNSDHSRVSNLPLKMLFFSYFNNHESIQLMSDCHNAINDKINKLANMIQDNFQEISSIVSDDNDNQHKRRAKQTRHVMQVIEEEDYWPTERSNDENQNITERNRNLLVKKFNTMIGMLEKSSNKFAEIMFMYKNQIKDIAKDLTKQRELNVKLIKEIEQKRSSKDVRQVRSSSISEIRSKKTGPTVLKTSSLKRQNPQKRPLSIQKQAQQSEDQQARPPPKPFCEQCVQREKQQVQRQKLQAQQKNKWRELSNKITNLKNQLSRYEEQLIGNQAEINRLNEELRRKNEDDTKTDSEEKKKIKTINTTLRGQKIVLQNQVQSLRKKLQQNTEYMSSLQTENKKLQMERDNLESTIKWHSNTIEDLRNNFSSGIKQEGQLLTKYNEVKEANTVLVEQIANQEKYLEQFVQNLQTVEDNFRQQTQTLNRKVQQLEEIIEQKNQTIIRLKLGKPQSAQSQPYNDHSSYKNPTHNKQLTVIRQNRCATKESVGSKRDNHLSGTILNKTLKRDPLTSGYSANENFEENMIKVLNKKLAIKECEIEKLRHDNEILRAQLEVYKQIE